MQNFSNLKNLTIEFNELNPIFNFKHLSNLKNLTLIHNFSETVEMLDFAFLKNLSLSDNGLDILSY